MQGAERTRNAICSHLSMQNVLSKHAGELGPDSIRHHFHLGLQNKLGLQMVAVKAKL